MEEQYPAELQKLRDVAIESEKLHSNITQDQLNDFRSEESCVWIFHLFNVYLDFLQNENGDLSTMWMSYIDMVDVVLGLIRASREGDWLLHLAMVKAMLPWTFAYDKQNYARYLSVYYTQMTRLELDHPETYDHLKNGGFSVQIGSSNPFGRIPVDQTIEETANKDTQTSGGTKGFSLNACAVSRYYMTAEYRNVCLRNLRQMVEVHTSGVVHADLEPSRILREEKDVQALLDLLENSWINPFSCINPFELVCLSTASATPKNVRDDLIHAKAKGEDACRSFRENRIETEEPALKFHDRIPKQKL